MGSCDVKKQVRFAVFPYVVEIPPRGPEWDEDDEEGSSLGKRSGRKRRVILWNQSRVILSFDVS